MQLIDEKALKKHLAKAESLDPDHALVEISERLLSRLPYMRLSPHRILDINGNELSEFLLSQAYPKAEIQTLSLMDLLDFKGKKDSVDLICAHNCLHWCNEPFALLNAFRQMLKQDGLLLFSTFGPDTLTELHQAFLVAEPYQHVHPFMDMHPIGDELLRLQFFEPVVDMEKIVLHYESLTELFADLKWAGCQNALQERPRHLLGRSAYQKMKTAYSQWMEEALFPATLEVIYGQAWVIGPRLARMNQTGEAVVGFDWIS